MSRTVYPPIQHRNRILFEEDSAHSQPFYIWLYSKSNEQYLTDISQETPKACRNFIALALEGYYDGVIFHRVVPGFLAQTGDRTGTGNGGESFYGGTSLIHETSYQSSSSNYAHLRPLKYP
ncbi:peptidyl-prolyl cis-trans isomerase, variant 2 [Coprinopsis cinerea AmutBmut pab1-1]|nr:peptidyl-prolyl cis-trans isomerase, variant 2 [Coprinopsis cinerea AmutBmut pab1-1]